MTNINSSKKGLSILQNYAHLNLAMQIASLDNMQLAGNGIVVRANSR